LIRLTVDVAGDVVLAAMNRHTQRHDTINT